MPEEFLKPSLFTQEHAKGNYYDGWTMAVEYFWKEGVSLLAVATASAGDVRQDERVAAEIVREHAPYGKLVVTWTAVRTGDHPEVPHPLPQSENLALDECYVKPHAPRLTPDGGRRIYTIEGKYVYLLKKPIWATDLIWMGYAPYDRSSIFANLFPADKFKKVF